MKKSRLGYLMIAAALLAAAPQAQAQTQRTNPRRDKNKTATEAAPSRDSLESARSGLAEQERQLRESLESARNLYASRPASRETIGKRIVELEAQIGEIATQIAALDAAIAAMPEAEPAATTEQTTAARRTYGKAALVENEYFSRNLPPEDYRALQAAQEQERTVDAMMRQLQSDHERLTELCAQYSIIGKGAQADALYAELHALATANTLLAERAAELWERIYETKTYAYTYLLDRENRYDLIAEQERAMNLLAMRESELAGTCMYEPAARYALQKEFLLRCETDIAERAELPAAKDSLKRAAASNTLAALFIPVVDTRERIFYDFADAAPVRPAQYTSTAQIPEVEIFSRGDIYRVLVGSYVRQPAIGTFKNFAPLSHELKTDGRHYYYAGGYATCEEAEAACDRFRKSGFTNARTVAWHDGRYNDNPAANRTATTAQTLYRIEITTGSAGLSSAVRDIINKSAAGKEVSRTTDKFGSSIFTISSFSSRETAEALCSELQSADSSLSIKLSEVD